MFEFLMAIKDEVILNGKPYQNGMEAFKAIKSHPGKIDLVLNQNIPEATPAAAIGHPESSKSIPESTGTITYKIKVKPYMTKPATPEFDFHDKWNEGKPMPLRIMVGTKLKETRGMVQMELHGDILSEISTHCVKCGKALTNPVSKYFGIGPECGQHGYSNPFDSKEELDKAVKEMKEQLNATTWTGWIIKSAIEIEEEI